MLRRYGHDMRDTRLLEVCHESRKVFIETFNHTLLGVKSEHLIRFNDDTVICIKGSFSKTFFTIFKLERERQLKRGGYKTPSWLSTIKKLAATFTFEQIVYLPLRLRILLEFSSLESFGLDVDYYSEPRGHWDASQAKQWIIQGSNRFSEVMEKLKEDCPPGYTIPELDIFQWWSRR